MEIENLAKDKKMQSHCFLEEMNKKCCEFEIKNNKSNRNCNENLGGIILPSRQSRINLTHHHETIHTLNAFP